MPPSLERWCWAAMVALAPMAPAAALAAAGGLLAAGWLARRRDERRPWYRGRAWGRMTRAWPVPVMVAVMALAAYHVAMASPWFDLLGLVAWGVVLAVVVPLPEEGARCAALRDGVMLGGLALVAVQSAAAGVDVIAWLSGAAGRVAGTTAHANVLASAMLLAAAALALLADRASGSRRRMAIVGLSLALVLALASGSRAAVLGAAAGGAMWALSTLVRPGAGPQAADSGVRRRRRGRRWMAWAVLAITVFAPLTIASVRGLPIEELLQREVERAVVFATALDIIAERPVLGHGGIPWNVLLERVEPALPVGAFAHAHSVPLHLAARGGAAGLLLAVLLAAGSYRLLRPHLAIVLSRPGIGPPVLAAAIASVAIQGAVDLVVINPAVYLVAAALVGTVTVVARGYHPDE